MFKWGVKVEYEYEAHHGFRWIPSFKSIPLTLQPLTSSRINNIVFNQLKSKKEYLARKCSSTCTTGATMALCAPVNITNLLYNT